jgi:hypothetical protein
VLGWLAQQKGLPIYSCKKFLILDKTLNPKPSSLPLLCVVDEFFPIHSYALNFFWCESFPDVFDLNYWQKNTCGFLSADLCTIEEQTKLVLRSIGKLQSWTSSIQVTTIATPLPRLLQV